MATLSQKTDEIAALESLKKDLAKFEMKQAKATKADVKLKIAAKIKGLRAQIKAGKTKGKDVSAKQLANSLLRSRKKFLEMSKKDFNGVIRQLSKKPEYSFLKGMSRTEVINDINRKAKPVGWRFKGRNNYKTPTKEQVRKGRANGTVYYENRANRSDVSQARQLAKGGSMASGGEVGDEVEIELTNGTIVKGKIEKLNPLKVRTDATSTRVIPNALIKNIKGGSTYAEGVVNLYFDGEKEDMVRDVSSSADARRLAMKEGALHYEFVPSSYAKGGSMASGGEIKMGDFVANKVHKTVGEVIDVFDRNDFRTDADGVVNGDDLEIYSKTKHKGYQIAPSTQDKMGGSMARGGEIIKTKKDIKKVFGSSVTDIDETENDYDYIVQGNLDEIKSIAKKKGINIEDVEHWGIRIWKYAKGGSMAKGGEIINGFNPKDFSLDEIDSKLISKDILLQWVRKGDTTYSAKDREFIWGGDKWDSKYWKQIKDKRFTMSDYGQIAMDKGSENLYLTVIVYEVDGSDEPMELQMYTKDNHSDLKAFANSFITKMKKGGSTYAEGGETSKLSVLLKEKGISKSEWASMSADERRKVVGKENYTRAIGYAKGGSLKGHGLAIGDEIVNVYRDDIYVLNRGVVYMVDLSSGKRTMTKMSKDDAMSTFEKGGNTEDETPVVRYYFEDDAYEYEKGGSTYAVKPHADHSEQDEFWKEMNSDSYAEGGEINLSDNVFIVKNLENYEGYKTGQLVSVVSIDEDGVLIVESKFKDKKTWFVSKDDVVKRHYGSTYAEGGEIDINDIEIPVHYTMFEEEMYEYGKGGIISVGDNVTVRSTGQTMEVSNISKNRSGQVEFTGSKGTFLIGGLKKN